MTGTKQPGALQRDRAGTAMLGDKLRTSTATGGATQAHCRSERPGITARSLPDGAPFNVQGRDAWALLELIRAGQRGCTPIDNPAPRWAAYVFKLKRKHGLAVETVYETHGGDFPGHHARYVLRGAVEILKGGPRHDPQA